MLQRDALLTLSKDVITRNDPSGLLLFQVSTDEIYLISREGGAMMRLADGSRTVFDIMNHLRGSHPQRDFETIHSTVLEFFERLVERGVLEAWV